MSDSLHRSCVSFHSSSLNPKILRNSTGAHEARLRNARYLAELTKFRMAPAGALFSLLKGTLEQVPG